MIIQIRGTSGSGKTTVVREFMEGLEWTAFYKTGRKKPLGYCSGEYPNGIVVMGHYEATCGGCDNIGSSPKIFEAIGYVREHLQPAITISEGLIWSEDAKWTPQFEEEVKILFLTTSADECVARIKSRRLEAGNDKPLNEDNTRNRVARIESARRRLANVENVTLQRASSKQAPRILRKWIEEYAN